MVSRTALACSAIGFLCLAAVFEGVGFAVPLWLVNKVGTGEDKITVYSGLWYVSVCVLSTCSTKVITINFQNFTQEPIVLAGGDVEETALNFSKVLGTSLYWIILLLAATVTTGFTVLITPIVIGCRGSKGCLAFSVCILMLASAVGLAISITYATTLAAIFDYELVSANVFPWALLIFGLGNVFGLVSAIVIIVMLCKWGTLKYDGFDRDPFAERSDDILNYDVTQMMETIDKEGGGHPVKNDTNTADSRF